MKIYTFEEIMDLYSIDQVFHDEGFDNFLKENFVQTYDTQLNFIGYARA